MVEEYYYIARYLQGGDITAPAETLDLAVTSVSSNSITLSWTAPGNDGIIGTASSYDIRYSTIVAIVSDVDFNSAAQAEDEPTPQVASSAETFTLPGLTPGTTYFFALKTTDEAGNTSGLSNSPKGITAAVPKDKYEIFGSTVPKIVIVNTWSTPLVSLVNIFGTTNPAREIGMSFSVSTYPAGAEGFSLSKSSEATNAQGLADVLLNLGNIPAEYGVTATCGKCEASARSVPFTCCGKLPNDDFKQSSSTWASQHYDNICTTVPASSNSYRPVYKCDAAIFNNPQYQKYKFTIRAKGCALSALATLINYYRDAYSLPISSATPVTLNKYLGDNSGYDAGGGVYFSKVSDWSGNRIVYVTPKIDLAQIINGEIVTRGYLIQLVKNELLGNRPVIVRVSSGHFILVVGLCGQNFIVSDPGTDQRSLYDPTKAPKLTGVRRFKKS